MGMMQHVLDSVVRRAQAELRRLLEDDCLAAAARGHWDVQICEWPDGWRTAVVEQGPGEAVMCVGPRRRIELDSNPAHVRAHVVTQADNP